ncbi:MAG: hypothetical protein ACSHXY_03500 [Alphaproteobacteria bacterium]
MASLQHKSTEDLLNDMGKHLAELMYRFHDENSKEHAKDDKVKKIA